MSDANEISELLEKNGNSNYVESNNNLGNALSFPSSERMFYTPKNFDFGLPELRAPLLDAYPSLENVDFSNLSKEGIMSILSLMPQSPGSFLYGTNMGLTNANLFQNLGTQAPSTENSLNSMMKSFKDFPLGFDSKIKGPTFKYNNFKAGVGLDGAFLNYDFAPLIRERLYGK